MPDSRPQFKSISATGMRFAVKFALLAGIALVTLFAVIGCVIGIMVHNLAEEQIDISGARIANALAAVDFDYWQAVSEQKAAKPTFVMINKAIGDEPVKLKDDPLKEAVSSSPGIIRAVVLKGKFEEARPKLILQYESVKGTGAELNYSDEKPCGDTGVLVARGEFTESGSNAKYPVRQYRKPIINPNGRELGSVIVFLSAKEIAATTNDFVLSVVFVWIAALMIAVLFSFLLSRMVTRPARRLAKDMEIIAAGDLDHKARGYRGDEIGALAIAFNRMTDGLKAARGREIERLAIERELGIATEIQASLLPVKVPAISDLDIGAVYKSAREVGGDYYDYIPIDDKHTGFIVADVSGKGIPGSMVMTMLRSLVRYEASGNPSPSDTLCKTNRILARDIKRGMFVTAFYAIFESGTGSVKLACAGHNPILYWHAKTASVREVKPEGLALGITAGEKFDRALKEVVINMEAGDRIVMYTDGVTEAMNKDGKEFGLETLGKIMSEHKNESSADFAEIVISHIGEHCGEVEQQDDITLINFIFRGSEAPA